MRNITPEDLYRLQFVHDPAISPDGKKILFTVTQAKGPNEYTGSIWKYANESLQLISGKDRVYSPVFSRVGDRFLYLASVAGGFQELWIS